jgi:hypothetical protein
VRATPQRCCVRTGRAATCGAGRHWALHRRAAASARASYACRKMGIAMFAGAGAGRFEASRATRPPCSTLTND